MLSNVQLRDVTEVDLPIIFEQHLDSTANYMAAFAAKDPTDWDAFMAYWSKVLEDQTIIKKTILFSGHVAGNILHFEQFGKPSIGYWIGKQFWGKGIATKALSEFLNHIKVRPLYARVAKDNIGSNRVLEKCGFMISGEDKGFSNTRGREVEEYIFKLE